MDVRRESTHSTTIGELTTMPRKDIKRKPDVVLRIRKYMEGAQAKLSHYMAEVCPALPPRALDLYIFDQSTRYAKIYCNDVVDGVRQKQGTIWAFVDMVNGNIHRPASAAVPAKPIIGNVFDDDYGLQYTTASGPMYFAEKKVHDKRK